MSEVIDRPKVDQPPVEDRRLEEVKPPERFTVEAWSPGNFCSGKLVKVITSEFSVPSSVAMSLVSAMQSTRKVPVALGLTKELAETKCSNANKMMDELVNGCPCGSRTKFVPVLQS